MATRRETAMRSASPGATDFIALRNLRFPDDFSPESLDPVDGNSAEAQKKNEKIREVTELLELTRDIEIGGGGLLSLDGDVEAVDGNTGFSFYSLDQLYPDEKDRNRVRLFIKRYRKYGLPIAEKDRVDAREVRVPILASALKVAELIATDERDFGMAVLFERTSSVQKASVRTDSKLLIQSEKETLDSIRNVVWKGYDLVAEANDEDFSDILSCAGYKDEDRELLIDTARKLGYGVEITDFDIQSRDIVIRIFAAAARKMEEVRI